ncbi:hypothetical protein LJB99_05860 [Deltaproteobacteria bacterium OttesenSCG-928-K17]|nr:hypothetical protein [Deltaproteobacteria bacterium OttesenSCG-928-K17]
MTQNEGRPEHWNQGGPKFYTEADIDAAIDLGLITFENAVLLKGMVLSGQSEPMADEENFRLISGFNDIFVVIASALLLTAIGWLLNETGGFISAVGVSAVAWGLAEYFVRQKRLALTAIVLLAAFSGGVFMAVGCYLDDAMGLPDRYIAAPACLIGAAMTWLHWRRFRVPVTVAIGAGAVVGLIVSLIAMAWPDIVRSSALAPIIMLGGLAVLGLAIKWDSTDPFRRTRRSDVAFWLHLLAAPLLVHPVFHLIGVFKGHIELAKIGVILIIYILMALVSLTLDRRALMVSSLVYVLYAFGSLFDTYGSIAEGFAFSALLIGGSLLLLAAFWRDARRLVLNCLPEMMLNYVPPSENER